ncbi:MAG: cytochrome o ubiquinol oxidase subunit I, partial [Arsenophonus sp. NC-QC1-MAG3]
MFGKLTFDSIPIQEPIIVITVICILLASITILGVITYFGKWKWLWSEWLTSVDHKIVILANKIQITVMTIIGS